MLGGSAIGTATTNGSGNWTYTPSSPIADGTYSLTATATDGAGNVSSPSSAESLTIDTVAPAAPTVTAPANGSASNVVSPVVTFSGEAGASATVEVDGVDYGPVTLDGSGSGQFSMAGPLSPGQHSVRVRLTDAAGNIGDWSNPSIWTVKLSTTVHLTGPTSGPTNATTPTVDYTSEAGDQYVITVDGQTAVTGVVPAGGTGSITLPTALPDGPNTIVILATDAAGNTASDSIVVTIDTVSPDPVQVGAAPASITSSTAATFSFSETKPGVSFQCSLDGATWTTCTSPVTFSGLAGGPHTLLLRAVDDAGNISAGTQYAWTVQSTPPAPPAILGGPAPATTAHATVFNFSASTGTTLECSVDGGTYAPCPARLSMNSLSMGAHSLAVRAVDEAGNVSTPTVYNWDVLPRTGARGLPTTSTLLVAANVTVAGRRDLLVGCNLNAGSVRRCVVTLYHDGRRIGTGVASERGNGHTHAVVKVWLNARGRGLIALADGGLPVTVRGAAFPVAFGALRARTHTILYPPMRFIVNDVRFRLDSFRLTPDGRAGVAAIAAQLTGAQSIVCEGNTDRSDSYAGSYNLGLSRAAAVCGLLHRLGVKAQSRLVSFAYDRPIATNATPAGRALNRRVVVLVNYRDLPAGQQ
jgi:outer membrane protein OmpA-like peptidoglycan-associated protein